MPISFACSQCGREFVVSDGLAGKPAVCKGCGTRMTVPGAAASPGASAAPATDEMVGQFGPVDATAVVPPAPRPAAPVFASPKPVSSGGGGMRFLWLFIVIGAVAFGAFRGTGLTQKSDVQAFHQRQYDLSQEFVTKLQAVKDVASAKATSGPMKATIQQMIDNIEKNGRKKARKADIDEVVSQFKLKNQVLEQQVAQEMMRVAMIPGALDALDVQAALERLEQLEQEFKGDAKKK